jgi:hypothetical protein
MQTATETLSSTQHQLHPASPGFAKLAATCVHVPRTHALLGERELSDNELHAGTSLHTARDSAELRINSGSLPKKD